jgi:hypothetical protein
MAAVERATDARAVVGTSCALSMSDDRSADGKAGARMAAGESGCCSWATANWRRAGRKIGAERWVFLSDMVPTSSFQLPVIRLVPLGLDQHRRSIGSRAPAALAKRSEWRSPPERHATPTESGCTSAQRVRENAPAGFHALAVRSLGRRSSGSVPARNGRSDGDHPVTHGDQVTVGERLHPVLGRDRRPRHRLPWYFRVADL